MARTWLVVPAIVAALVAVAAVRWLNAGAESSAGGEGARDRPVHVHGLGVNPADGALFIATHTGLWRLDRDGERPLRVGPTYQDTMGFTVAAPDRFFGSGHPDLREDLPPHLGLIESADAGESWASVSLLGQADFHVLRFVGARLYGYDVTNQCLLVSGDRGRRWTELTAPGLILDLAVHPGTGRRLVAATDRGLVASDDGGAAWVRIGSKLGSLAWPSPQRLYLVDAEGTVFASVDGGTALERVGSVGAEPAALLAVSADELYVALHDGGIRRSTDGGSTWSVRATP